MTRLDRAIGALTGLAVGDALGMPTQARAPAAIGRVEGFRAADPDHPLAHGLPAGHVTDDTEQALLLADVLIEGDGRIDPALLARRLAAWEEGMRARGSADLLGPSTRAAVRALQEGADPVVAGADGTTNGAAMRITPVGIAMDAADLPAFVDRVTETCVPTHGTSVAIAGAAAVAAAVSIAVDGADLDTCVVTAMRAARLGAVRGRWVAGADVAARIALAVGIARDDREAAASRIVGLVGTSLATQESVPAAFGVLALHPHDPWLACCTAASLGGDTDTIAAMAGAIGGALHGVLGFPRAAVETLLAVNAPLDLDRRAEALLALR